MRFLRGSGVPREEHETLGQLFASQNSGLVASSTGWNWLAPHRDEPQPPALQAHPGASPPVP